jgi:hypothetical protein
VPVTDRLKAHIMSDATTPIDEIHILRQQVAAMQARLDVLTGGTAVARPVGRPPAIIPLDRVHELSALGLSVKTIAARLGVGLRTLQERAAADPELRAALDEGLAVFVEDAATGLRQLVAERNLGAICFALKTRGGFTVREEQSPAVTINLGSQPATISTAHADELAEQQRAILMELDDF